MDEIESKDLEYLFSQIAEISQKYEIFAECAEDKFNIFDIMGKTSS